MVSEGVIRDKLAENLEVIEPGLRLLQKEAYLPGVQGARGFVDLLARDRKGHFVLIELKKNDSASRDAVHEVLKYVENVKSYLAVVESELRVIIASVTWHELIVPFSSLHSRVGFALEGAKIFVNDHGITTDVIAVEPLPITSGRLFAPWHELRFYNSETKMKLALKAIESDCERKGISDYVVIEMHAEDHHASAETARRIHTLTSMIGDYAGNIDDETVTRLATKTIGLLYFAMLQLADQSYLEIIERLTDREHFEEFLESIDDSEGEDRTFRLHEEVECIDGEIPSDGLEIGYPAKFSAFERGDEWRTSNIYRFGALARNEILTDSTICSELRGEQGVTKQRYSASLAKPDAKSIAKLGSDLNAMLVDNPQWRAMSKIALEQVSLLNGIEEIRVEVMNPCNTLLHIFLSIASDDIQYLPTFQLRVHFEGESLVYVGHLVPNGGKPSLGKILEEHYENTAVKALWSMNWGGYEKDNAKVTRDAGLNYGFFQFDPDAVDRKDYSSIKRFSDLGLEPSSREEIASFFERYFSENKRFIHDVCRMYGECWNGTFVDYDHAEQFTPTT